MAKALVAGKYMAIEADDKSFWSIRRYDHYLTLEEARGIPSGEWEQVAMALDKEGAKVAIAHQIELENNTP